MNLEQGARGAPARVVFIAGLLLALLAGAAPHVAAHVRIAGIAHYHRHCRSREPNCHGRRFDARPSGPILRSRAVTFGMPAAQQTTVFGHYRIAGAVFSHGFPVGGRFAGPEIGAPRNTAANLVRQIADRLGVPANLALAIMHYESGGRCGMRGRAGERGAMQVLPQTARSVGIVGDLYDCATGIEAGLRYLKLALTMHAGAGWCAVASAYNSGTWQGSRCTRYGRAIALGAGLK